MTAPAEAAVRALAERDGCGCPPWVLQCVHFDEAILWLCDHAVARPLIPQHPIGSAAFSVAGDHERKLVPCSCGGNHLVWREATESLFATEAEARDEFALREAKLLGREEA